MRLTKDSCSPGTRFYASTAAKEVPVSKQKYIPDSGTYPQGFSVSGIHVGVKASNKDSPDLTVITSNRPCAAAAVFTKNKFQAAPVVVSRETLEARDGDGIHGVVINAGCANAVTGQGGLDDARAMAAAMDSSLSLETSPSSTLVMSTGVIGQRLPISKILNGIPQAIASRGSDHNAWLSAARGICTTDTFPKLVSTTFTLPSSPNTTYRLAGLAKGAGMIHPNMATLLGIFCTDMPSWPNPLRAALAYAVDRSFNSISVDGDMSTNDTIALLANGAAAKDNFELFQINDKDPDYVAFRDALTSLAQRLSQLVVRDGEGATKFVHVRVTQAKSFDAAKKIASSIARSPLVKTALYGKDANWGRILCAVGGTEGVEDKDINPDATSVSFVPRDGSPDLKLLVNGEPEKVDEDRAKRILEEEDLEIRVELGTGKEEASYWFCDFSHEYVTSEFSFLSLTCNTSLLTGSSQWRLSDLSKCIYRLVVQGERSVYKQIEQI